MDRECMGGLTWRPSIMERPFQDYINYQRQILSERTTIQDFWPKITIEGGEEEMLRMDEEKDIYFLYKETWDGKEVSDLENSHLVNILLKLERDVCKNKTAFELFVLDHSSDKLLKPIYDITELAKMEPRAWLEETPIWKTLNAELEKRNLKEYYEVVSAREAAAREKKGE